MSQCTLRMIHVSDVYTLDHFPSLRTLIIEKKAEMEKKGGTTISILTGDFLAPYLLSSVDHGVGMMDALNATPIDYLIWGNHESDLAHRYVLRREKEYKGCWINTNMQDHESFKDSTCQVPSKVLELASLDGTNRRKVGMIGVNSDSPSLYKPGAFGGATIQCPWETMKTYKAKLETEEKVDVVVPLCHLYEPQDERTCREFDFPMILSGHDHHTVDRVVQGTRLLKPGLDAHKAIVIDMTWDSATSPGNAPTITAEFFDVKSFAPCPTLAAQTQKSYSVLDRLRHTQLCTVPEHFRPLTSFGAREKRISMGTYLLTQFKDALNDDLPKEGTQLHCDCCIIKGGNIRGGKAYETTDQITLEVLQSELQGEKEVQMCLCPGEVLRVGLRETFGAPNPGWFQYDEQVVLDSDGYVTSIDGAPLDPKRLYRVATFEDFFRARDGPAIGKYFEEHPEHAPEKDGGVPCHALLMHFFAEEVWRKIHAYIDVDGDGEITQEELKVLDEDGDGKLSKEELRHAIQRILHMDADEQENTFINEILAEAGDADGDGCLTVTEINAQAMKRKWSRSGSEGELPTPKKVASDSSKQ